MRVLVTLEQDRGGVGLGRMETPGVRVRGLLETRRAPCVERSSESTAPRTR